MRSVIFAIAAATALSAGAHAQDLPPPAFHHLMLNSADPDAAIAFYVKAFADSHKTTWEGYPALATPNNVLIVFNKAATPPPADSLATAYWHFGWNTIDQRKKVAELQAEGFKFAPLYTGIADNSVTINTDTYAGAGGHYATGRTQALIAEAQAQHLTPPGGGGFAYLMGPDNALIEVNGDFDKERFYHVHMWEEQPFCALIWYEKHLNATPAPGGEAFSSHTEANCKVAHEDRTWPALTLNGQYRWPMVGEGVLFSGVSMKWYMNQTDKPLVPTRGRLMDHVSLSVHDLDAWIAKLRREGVKFLRPRHMIGATPAVMIEGPSHEAIELIEVK